jgi:5-methylcytosine-specific restriction endonuclease McrA
MARRYPQARGTCRICGKKGQLDPHHIISQAQCRKKNREDLITNPGNIVHICRECHKLTTSYLVRERRETKRNKKKAKPKPKGRPRCEAMTEMFDRCKNRATSGHHVCGYHRPRRKPGFRRKW